MRFNEAKFREGQRIIFRAMCERIIYGELVTGIVLHPRGGKSDLQRMLTIWGISQGYLCAGVSVNINCLLRDQMGDNDRVLDDYVGQTRMEEAIRRYEVGALRNMDTVGVVGYRGWPEAPFSRNETFASFTIQTLTAKAGSDGLMQWVESMVAKGPRPIFFFDECQTLGGLKPWAKLFYDLRDRGAFVVSMTGTPHREDGEPIPGFTMDVLDTYEVEKLTVKSHVDPDFKKITLKRGDRTHFILRGHIEVGLDYGWNPPEGERPSLCNLSRDTFDFEVNAEGDGCPEYSGLISGAPESVVRKVLGRSLKEPEIISAAVKKMVYHLSQMRISHPDVKAIVFTGNDNAQDESNAHAKQVAKEVHRHNPSLTCMIVTSSLEGPDAENIAKKIASFNDSKYDILIVKQAGGIGLDADRIKVGLDLSTIRAYGSGTQRLLRIATPFQDLLQAVWICPQDIMWERIWEGAVQSNNGEMSITKLEDVYSRLEKKTEEDPPTAPLILNFGKVIQGAIYDNTGKVSDASSVDLEAVEFLLASRPYLRNRLTLPELLDLSKAVEAGAGFGVDENDLVPPSEPELDVPVVEHSGTGLCRLRETMNLTASRIAKNELFRQNYTIEQMYAKRPGGNSIYGSHLSKIWHEAKVGIIENTKSPLSSIIDIGKLNTINERLNERERRIGGSGETRISA